jgi:hypothetical protein
MIKFFCSCSECGGKPLLCRLGIHDTPTVSRDKHATNWCENCMEFV